MSEDSCKSHLAVSEKVQLFLQTLRQEADTSTACSECPWEIGWHWRWLWISHWSTSRSGRVVRERRDRHEPASGRRRRRQAPARLAEAKAGQVGICGGRTGLDICSGCRDPSIPPLQVSKARSENERTADRHVLLIARFVLHMVRSVRSVG